MIMFTLYHVSSVFHGTQCAFYAEDNGFFIYRFGQMVDGFNGKKQR